MEDTQDIRGNEIVQNDKSILNKELSKPVEVERFQQNQPLM